MGTHNTVNISMDNLFEDQKKEVEMLVQKFQEMCLESFSSTYSETTIEKALLRSPILHGVTSTSPPKVVMTTAGVHEIINQAIHHALINKFGVLVNTLQSLIKKTLEGTAYKETDRGLTYFNTSGYN
jgi:hypothetical protein